MPFGTFLNGRTPTQLRGLQWLTLSDQATIGSRSYASDNGGGATATWTYGGTIPCRIDPVGAIGLREGVVAERMSDRSTHRITLPANTSADTEDRVRVIGRGTFEVTAVDQVTAEWVHVVEVSQVF